MAQVQPPEGPKTTILIGRFSGQDHLGNGQKASTASVPLVMLTRTRRGQILPGCSPTVSLNAPIVPHVFAFPVSHSAVRGSSPPGPGPYQLLIEPYFQIDQF